MIRIRDSALPGNKEFELLLKTALPILQGLLASGHYTEESEYDDGETQGHLRWDDAGKNWKEDGFRRRLSCLAVQDAIRVAEDLLEDIDDIIEASRP